MELRKNSIFLATFWIFAIAFVSAVDELQIQPNSTSVKGLFFHVFSCIKLIKTPNMARKRQKWYYIFLINNHFEIIDDIALRAHQKRCRYFQSISIITQNPQVQETVGHNMYDMRFNSINFHFGYSIKHMLI